MVGKVVSGRETWELVQMVHDMLVLTAGEKLLKLFKWIHSMHEGQEEVVN